MLLKLAATDPLPLVTTDGSVFYPQGGRAIGRQKVSGVRPLSKTQAAEVSGIAAGSRAWAYALTAADQASWNACPDTGLNGFWTWLRIYSAITQGLDLLLPAGTACTASDPVIVSDFVLNPATEDFTFMPSVSDATSSTGVVLRASRPLPVGRVPRLEDTRVIGLYSPDVTADAAADYLARFGSFPVSGSELLAVTRAITPDEQRMSVTTSTFAFAAAGGDSASITLNTNPIAPFGVADFSGLVEFVDAGEFDLVTLSVLTAGWSLSGASTFLNTLSQSSAVDDTDGTERTEDVTFRFTLDDPPNTTIDVVVSITVENPVP